MVAGSGRAIEVWMSERTQPVTTPAPADAADTVAVHVRYFAVLRECRGVEEEQLDLPAGTTAAGLHAQLFAGRPEAAMPVLYAVDQAYVDGDTPLHDGAEVAFIPPLGGG